MIFKKLLSITAIIIALITGSSFKLNNNYRARAAKVYIPQKIDSTAREKILKETGIHIPNHVPKEHVKTIYSEAKKQKIPLGILVRLIKNESNFDSKSVNRNSGAIGYMQLMPSTYSQYRRKLKLTRSPENNIKVGSFYLKEMYDIWDRKDYSERRKWRLALASYNAGIDRVIKIKRVPDIKETRSFVNYILE